MHLAFMGYGILFSAALRAARRNSHYKVRHHEQLMGLPSLLRIHSLNLGGGGEKNKELA